MITDFFQKTEEGERGMDTVEQSLLSDKWALRSVLCLMMNYLH